MCRGSYQKLLCQFLFAGDTEELNRRWYEANTGQVLTDVQQEVRHPTLRWMAATLDGRVAPARPDGQRCSVVAAAFSFFLVNQMRWRF